MQFDEDSLHEYLKTRFFAPAWWVHAFDSMFQAENSARFWEQVPSLGVGPSFDLQEFYLLPLVISHIQQGLLKSDSLKSTVQLDPISIEKEAGIHLLSRKKFLKQLFASLGSLKLYHKSALGFDAQTLFSGERWAEQNGKLHLALDVQPFAKEVFTGYINAYKEISRSLERRVGVRQMIGDRPPIVLWRSLWHEAQGVEQLVLLRMEQAVQWSFNCLNLDGVFGASFKSLFKGVKDQSQQGQPYSLTKMVSIIHRLSKKLGEHGSLCKPADGEYLAFDDHEPLLQLLWKVSPSHFKGDDIRAFGQATFGRFKKERSFLSDIKQALLGFGGADIGEDTRKHYEKVLSCQDLLEQASKEGLQDYWIIDNNVLLPMVGLYWEWVLRKGHQHPCPLPDELIHTEVLNALPDVSADLTEHKECYWRFRQQISEKDLYKEVVNKVPGACLASIKSIPLLEEKAYKGVGSTQISPTKSSHLVKNEIKSEKKVKSSSNPRVDNLVQSSKSQSNPTKKYELKSDNEVSLGREDIVEALNQMKKNSREKYLKLTKLYLESLDQGARQLILEIKNRMQPQVFDQHIQHRLVRFMLERPSAWKNLST